MIISIISYIWFLIAFLHDWICLKSSNHGPDHRQLSVIVSHCQCPLSADQNLKEHMDPWNANAYGNPQMSDTGSWSLAPKGWQHAMHWLLSSACAEPAISGPCDSELDASEPLSSCRSRSMTWKNTGTPMPHVWQMKRWAGFWPTIVAAGTWIWAM